MKPLKFALATPGLLNYPAAMAPWEKTAKGGEVLRFAKAADKQKWQWLTVPEHVFMPEDMCEMMGSRFPEGVAACAVLAGATERIHLLTYVLVLPYRNPLMLAKQIASIEFIAGGRFTLGTAPGHLEKEFDALNIPFKARGKITDEYLQVLKECWTSDRPKYSGYYTQFDHIVMDPKPVQKPHPPIFIGGNTKVAMRRAAEHGDGWIPWLITRDKLAECIKYLQDQPGFEEKKDRFEIVMPTTEYQVEDYSHKETADTRIESGRDEIMRDLELLQKAGATVAQVMPPRVESFEQCLDWLAWFDEDVIPNFI
ncbi:TIGR03619 family F420-dependent LLM class oxidoreductase [Seongchinamella sediminis]|uniref:TIGR03619 family F420-dependent LLM class oxidoreductase n=1 Tax=Seongchinamella sediminis TaxID=2283635 RepID=A0A3L7DVF8_9GAMM|nr:TIGR03619 family F420-dependent LLM class oxidoreductase [Seongchinamella sediminis]RLQ21106.1 TIGR03619 family F420-dependent LLM class oxidoreductase [Seongchinamella sediminis]